MKTRFLLFTFFLCVAITCRAQVQIDSVTQVKIDGQAAGDLVTAIRQNPQRANAILDALDAKLTAASADVARAKQALANRSSERDHEQKRHEQEIQSLRDELSGLQARYLLLQNQLADLVPLLDVVEASALPAAHKAALRAARLTEAQRKRAALEAQQAALAAELAKLPPQ